MGFLNFKPASPPPPKPKQQKKKPKVAFKKPSSERKRPLPEDSYVYGDELFALSLKKEKQVLISFHEFTKNLVRISKCRRYAIEYFPINISLSEEYFNVYCFADDSLQSFNPEKLTEEYKIPKELAKDKLEGIINIVTVRDKIVEWETAMILSTKEEKRKLAIEADNKMMSNYLEEKRRKEDEEEAKNESINSSKRTYESDSASKIKAEHEKDKELSNIQQQKTEEIKAKISQVSSPRARGIFFFKKS